MKKIFLFISVCSLYFSCFKTVFFDLPNQKKYVLFSIISPDQPSIKVDFHPITPLNQNISASSLKNAEVKIIRLSDGEEYTLTYQNSPLGLGRYEVDVDNFVLPLDRYKIQINYQGDQIEAITQVPAQENYSIVYRKAIAKEKEDLFVIYDFLFDLSMTPQIHYFYFNWKLNAKTQNGSEINTGGTTSDPRANLYSNAFNNSFKSKIEFKNERDLLYYPVIDDVTEAVYNFTLLEVNQDYFKYHNNIQFPLNSIEAAFSDPVSSYTNVQGGYGVFGAYISYNQSLNHFQVPQILTDLNDF